MTCTAETETKRSVGKRSDMTEQERNGEKKVGTKTIEETLADGRNKQLDSQAAESAHGKVWKRSGFSGSRTKRRLEFLWWPVCGHPPIKPRSLGDVAMVRWVGRSPRVMGKLVHALAHIKIKTQRQTRVITKRSKNEGRECGRRKRRRRPAGSDWRRMEE